MKQHHAEGITVREPNATAPRTRAEETSHDITVMSQGVLCYCGGGGSSQRTPSALVRVAPLLPQLLLLSNTSDDTRYPLSCGCGVQHQQGGARGHGSAGRRTDGAPRCGCGPRVRGAHGAGLGTSSHGVSCFRLILSLLFIRTTWWSFGGVLLVESPSILAELFSLSFFCIYLTCIQSGTMI